MDLRRVSAWATSPWYERANRYYLFATGGGAWVSSDLVDWKYQAVEVSGARIPVAPHVVEYNGAFYMSGNGAPLYKASDILGPYELVGPWKNEKGEPWKGSIERQGLGRRLRRRYIRR